MSTAETIGAVELAETYTRRWPLQKNSIRDFLLPLGWIPTTATAKGWWRICQARKETGSTGKTAGECADASAEGARKRSHNASKLYTKRCQQTKERAKERYRLLNNHQIELEQQGVKDWELRKTIKEEKAVVDAEIEEYQQRQWKAYETSN